MQTVGIKELKNSLSRYLASVKNGEEIIITERGKPFARIISEKPTRVSFHEALKPLILEGIVSMPGKDVDRDVRMPREVPGKSVSDMVVEDRR